MPIERRYEPSQELIGKIAFDVGVARQPQPVFREGVHIQDVRRERERIQAEAEASRRARQKLISRQVQAEAERNAFLYGNKAPGSARQIGVPLDLPPEVVTGIANIDLAEQEEEAFSVADTAELRKLADMRRKISRNTRFGPAQRDAVAQQIARQAATYQQRPKGKPNHLKLKEEMANALGFDFNETAKVAARYDEGIDPETLGAEERDAYFTQRAAHDRILELDDLTRDARGNIVLTPHAEARFKEQAETAKAQQQREKLAADLAANRQKVAADLYAAAALEHKGDRDAIKRYVTDGLSAIFGEPAPTGATGADGEVGPRGAGGSDDARQKAADAAPNDNPDDYLRQAEAEAAPATAERKRIMRTTDPTTGEVVERFSDGTVDRTPPPTQDELRDTEATRQAARKAELERLLQDPVFKKAFEEKAAAGQRSAALETTIPGGIGPPSLPPVGEEAPRADEAPPVEAQRLGEAPTAPRAGKAPGIGEPPRAGAKQPPVGTPRTREDYLYELLAGFEEPRHDKDALRKQLDAQVTRMSANQVNKVYQRLTTEIADVNELQRRLSKHISGLPADSGDREQLEAERDRYEAALANLNRRASDLLAARKRKAPEKPPAKDETPAPTAPAVGVPTPTIPLAEPTPGGPELPDEGPPPETPQRPDADAEALRHEENSMFREAETMMARSRKRGLDEVERRNLVAIADKKRERAEALRQQRVNDAIASGDRKTRLGGLVELLELALEKEPNPDDPVFQMLIDSGDEQISAHAHILRDALASGNLDAIPERIARMRDELEKVGPDEEKRAEQKSRRSAKESSRPRKKRR